jgi:hypothetical protein
LAPLEKIPEPQEVTNRALRRNRNGDTPLGYLERRALRREQYDEMPESGNSGIGSEVDFLGNELLRQLHDNSEQILRKPTISKILHDNRRTQLLGKVFSIQLEKNYLKRMTIAA